MVAIDCNLICRMRDGSKRYAARQDAGPATLVVIGGHQAQPIDGGAGVDAKQGVVVAASRADRHLARGGSRPRPPHRMAPLDSENPWFTALDRGAGVRACC